MRTINPTSLQKLETQRGLLQIMDTLPTELLDMISGKLGFKDKLSFSIANGKEAYATFTETNAATYAATVLGVIGGSWCLSKLVWNHVHTGAM